MKKKGKVIRKKMSKREAKHVTDDECPEGQKYIVKAGKCDFENKEYTEDPARRDKAASNLTFAKSGPSSAFIVRKEDIKPDTHIDVVDFQKDAKSHQNKQRRSDTRAPPAVDSGDVPGIKHKQFKNRNFGVHGI